MDLDESITSEVRTDDDKRLSVKGKGDILVQTKKWAKCISSVFYVPGLKHNLLRLVQLLLRGFHVHFNEDMYEIKDKHDTLITKVKMTQHKMFSLKLNSQIDSCMHTTIQDKSWLWHFRFGHLSFKTLSHMCNKNIVEGIPLIELQGKYVKDAHLASIT